MHYKSRAEREGSFKPCIILHYSAMKRAINCLYQMSLVRNSFCSYVIYCQINTWVLWWVNQVAWTPGADFFRNRERYFENNVKRMIYQMVCTDDRCCPRNYSCGLTTRNTWQNELQMCVHGGFIQVYDVFRCHRES